MRMLVRGLSAATLMFAMALLVAQCGGGKAPSGQESTAVSVAALPGPQPGLGAKGFLAYCGMCHGDGGAGDGPLAAALGQQGIVVLRLDDQVRMQKLGREGVRKVVVMGGAHTRRSNLMPAWGEMLSPALVDSIVDFVLTIPLTNPGVPSAVLQGYLDTPAGSAETGRKLFVFYCTACHGPQGKGDGFNADTLRIRNNIRPRDLTETAYFTGKTDEQLYATVAMGGGHMGKSEFMPAWSYTLKPEEIKDLVSYVRVLSHTRPAP